MKYDVDELVKKIKEAELPKRGGSPSERTLKFAEVLTEIAACSKQKGIEKLSFSQTNKAIAAQLEWGKKPTGALYQAAKIAAKYAEGVEIIKEDGKLFYKF